MMFPIQNEYYGDETRWFVGRVIDSTPPYGLEGRVKVRIDGVHTKNTIDIPQADLPWAHVLLPGNSFGTSGFGSVPQIAANALVFGIFLDGKQSQLPIVLGTIPTIEYPTSVQTDSKDDTSSNLFAYEYTQSNYEGVDPKVFNLDVENSDERKTIAFNFFLDNGFTLKQTCGIVGLLFSIADLDPTFENEEFFGIAAWEKQSNRFIRLTRFASLFSPGKDVKSFDLQLIFVLNELRTTRTVAQSKILATEEYKGSANGIRIGSREIRNNGSVAAMYTYYLSNKTKTLTAISTGEDNAESIYNGAK